MATAAGGSGTRRRCISNPKSSRKQENLRYSRMHGSCSGVLSKTEGTGRQKLIGIGEPTELVAGRRKTAAGGGLTSSVMHIKSLTATGKEEYNPCESSSSPIHQEGSKTGGGTYRKEGEEVGCGRRSTGNARRSCRKSCRYLAAEVGGRQWG